MSIDLRTTVKVVRVMCAGTLDSELGAWSLDIGAWHLVLEAWR